MDVNSKTKDIVPTPKRKRVAVDTSLTNTSVTSSKKPRAAAKRKLITSKAA
jgi:hypothetical protein